MRQPTARRIAPVYKKVVFQFAVLPAQPRSRSPPPGALRRPERVRLARRMEIIALQKKGRTRPRKATRFFANWRALAMKGLGSDPLEPPFPPRECPEKPFCDLRRGNIAFW